MISRFLCWLFGHEWMPSLNCVTDEDWRECMDCGLTERCPWNPAPRRSR